MTKTTVDIEIVQTYRLELDADSDREAIEKGLRMRRNVIRQAGILQSVSVDRVTVVSGGDYANEESGEDQ